MNFEPSLSWVRLSDSENDGKSVYVRVDQIYVFGDNDGGSRIQLANNTYVLVDESPEDVSYRIVGLISGHP